MCVLPCDCYVNIIRDCVEEDPTWKAYSGDWRKLID